MHSHDISYLVIRIYYIYIYVYIYMHWNWNKKNKFINTFICDNNYNLLFNENKNILEEIPNPKWIQNKLKTFYLLVSIKIMVREKNKLFSFLLPV